MSYPYTRRSLLDQAEHYMYAPFDGAGFLRAYFHDREECLESLAARLSAAGASGLTVAISEWPHHAAVEPPAPLPSPDAHVASTDRLLEGMVQATLADAWRGERSAWMEVLRAKFEVSKRLRDAYAGGQPLERGSVGHVERYANFAFLLASNGPLHSDLRILNALLKADDIVVSAHAQLHAAPAIAAARAALVAERDAVLRLLTQHGVEASA